MQKHLTTKTHADRWREGLREDFQCLPGLGEGVAMTRSAVNDLPAPVRRQIERLYIHQGLSGLKQSWRLIME